MKKKMKTREDEYNEYPKVLENETEKDTYFSDNADIVRHATKIHTNETGMSEDYPLARMDDKKKKFIIQAHKIADSINDFIIDKEVAKDTAKIVRREANHIIIMERNNPNNWLLRKVFGRTYVDDMDKEQDEQNQGLIAGAMNGLFGKKKSQENQKYE